MRVISERGDWHVFDVKEGMERKCGTTCMGTIMIVRNTQAVKAEQVYQRIASVEKVVAVIPREMPTDSEMFT